MLTHRLLSLTFTGALTTSLAAGCARPRHDVASTKDVSSPMAASTLQAVKAALPKVAYPGLQTIFNNSQTFWYDHASMKPSYQAAILESPPYGANSNDRWFDLIASSVQPTARHFYDESKKRWRFPFGITAGTDDASNFKVVDFLALPSADGKLLPVAIAPKPSAMPNTSFSENSWGWVYPNGAVVGEMIFVTTAAGDLLPAEIRTRTRYASGWAVNSYRPFPTATSLSAAVKQRRPNWKGDAKLATLVASLDRTDTLTTQGLHATNLPGTFDQDGALDILPDFGDDALVKELLTQTTFISGYATPWKTNNGTKTYAASTNAALSIVPTNYQAGVIEVGEASCMRCHKDTGRHLPDFNSSFGDIILYGDMWGRDGIFSFHPFDESQYGSFWNEATRENRKMNPALVSQGVIATFNASVHKAPLYPADEIGGGVMPAGITNFLGVGGGSSAGTGPAVTPPPATNSDPKIVEFHIPAGTGGGEWNLQNTPVRAKAGQIVRIINDDGAGHVLHTNGDPCPHGDTENKVERGDHYDCAIPSGTPAGTSYRLWDHYLGSPNSGRFWITVN